MTTKTTVAIAPEAALRAVSAENEWRRNRILVLENEVFRMEREVEALRAASVAEAKPEEKKASGKINAKGGAQ